MSCPSELSASSLYTLYSLNYAICAKDKFETGQQKSKNVFFYITYKTYIKISADQIKKLETRELHYIEGAI